MKKNKKKLLILIWSMNLGGIQKRMRDITLDIDKNYCDWEIYFLIKNKENQSHFLHTIQQKTKAQIVFFSDVFKSQRNFPFALWVAYHYLKIKPNVCLAFLDDLSVIMVAVSKIIFWIKSKVVLNEGVLTSKYLKINRRNFYWPLLIKKFYPLADQIITPTIEIKKDLVSNFNTPSKIIKILPNWTLLSNKKRSEPIYDLIFVSRFEEEKNPLGFVDIVKEVQKKYPAVSAAMLGVGKQLNSVLTLITKYQLNKNIILFGLVDDPEKYLAQSKILVLPTRNEGMPNVVLEAAMKKVPTVSSNFSGAREVIIDQKTGLIGNDTKQMSQQVIQLLKNKNLSEKMGVVAQKYVQENFHRKRQQDFINTLLN